MLRAPFLDHGGRISPHFQARMAMVEEFPPLRFGEMAVIVEGFPLPRGDPCAHGWGNRCQRGEHWVVFKGKTGLARTRRTMVEGFPPMQMRPWH